MASGYQRVDKASAPVNITVTSLTSLPPVVTIIANGPDCVGMHHFFPPTAAASYISGN